ncbi:MAG: patatin-like phospholipase family protein [Bacteroides sp.]|nr:patatin-like phospholipase family protein [Bacteroides sp.]MCM1379483.1 patatin-like phospholipase family protein [Bacteroides sp.]MCM1445914.1 patatin-like phospholipase family protein [Prevotella sp.]
MKKLITILISIIATLAASGEQSVGLVLSGGGAKGIAHIGVIQALEENDIPIDYITGTSMGAIVGGLYAAGYSPSEMMQLLGSPLFINASQGTIDPDMRYYLTAPQPTPQMFSLAMGNDSVAKSVPQSIISPIVMNFAFMEVFAEASQRCGGNFDNLFVPLRTVSSNIKAQRPEISRSGRLADAVRASMSFPIVFCPIEINDTLHYDGGIFENFPLPAMEQEFHPDILIGLDVHTPDSVKSTPNLINQINNLVTRSQSYDLPAERGVKIHMDLHRFSLLDFGKAAEIYEIGYRRGLEMVDSIKSRITTRRTPAEVSLRRKEFKAGFTPLKFSEVVCTGGTTTQNSYIESLFPTKQFGLDRARDGFYRAISGGRMQNLQVYAQPTDSGTYILHLKAYPKPNWSAGIGGYISSSTSSMLYASIGYNALNKRAINGSLGAWIGQSYQAAQLLAMIRFGINAPYSLAVQGVVSKHSFNQTEKMFFMVDDPKFVTKLQLFARAYPVQLTCGRHAVASLSAGYGYKRLKFTDETGNKLTSALKLGQVALRYDYNTLDAIDYPTSGLEIHASAMGLLGHRIFCNNKKPTKWLQLRAKVRKYWDIERHFSFGLESELLISGRKPKGLYEAVVAEAPSYAPTPSCFNSFNASFRAYSYLGAGITPIYKINNRLQLRGTFHIFAPWQRLQSLSDSPYVNYSSYPSKPEFFGEVQALVDLKYVNLCAYGNYRTGSAADRGWHIGISLGIFALAPDFLK